MLSSIAREESSANSVEALSVHWSILQIFLDTLRASRDPLFQVYDANHLKWSQRLNSTRLHNNNWLKKLFFSLEERKKKPLRTSKQVMRDRVPRHSIHFSRSFLFQGQCAEHNNDQRHSLISCNGASSLCIILQWVNDCEVTQQVSFSFWLLFSMNLYFGVEKLFTSTWKFGWKAIFKLGLMQSKLCSWEANNRTNLRVA